MFCKWLTRCNDKLTARLRNSPAQSALWYGNPDAIANAISYAKFFSRSHHAVIRVYDEAGNVIDTYEHAGEFREP